MANKEELLEKKKRLEDALGAVPEEFVREIEQELEATNKELEQYDNVPSPQPEEQKSDDFIKAMVSSIATLMASGEGTGVDSPTIRGIIKEYLQTDKVKLDELDKSILEEIKKNQTVILQIPAFGKQIQISSAVARIPNFFEIIDDVLAGNNVYLIGEAGGGKTYTAEQVAQTLGREAVTLNCSQYTSPLEILGGQSIDGFKEGKLIDCWKKIY
jgi:cobaltochelatase CobS